MDVRLALRRHRSLSVLSLALSVASFAFLLWRCQFGIELYDEPFYLLPGFKNFPLGDLPFRHEVHNSIRHFDILNYLLIQPWHPYSLLALRWSAVGVYGLLLAIFVFLCFRKRWPLSAGIVFSGCLLFDSFLMPVWSHNWWFRDLLLLHHILLLIGLRLESFQKQKWMASAAGLSIGLGIVAYQPMAIALAVALSVALFAFKKSSTKVRYPLFPYLAGAAIPMMVDVAYVLLPSVFPLWKMALETTLADYAGLDKVKASKWHSLGYYLLTCRELFLVILLGAIAFNLRSKRWPKLTKLYWVVAIATGAYFVKSFFYIEYVFLVKASLVGLGVGGAGYLLFSSFRRGRMIQYYLVSLSLAVTAFWGFCSHNAAGAFFWAMPTLVAPFVAAVYRDFHFSRLALSNARRAAAWSIHILLCFIVIGSFRYQILGEKFDGPLTSLTTKITKEPLHGIYTSPRRAYLIEKLAEIVEGKDFALTAGLIGALYFSQTRSAVDTVMYSSKFPSLIGYRGFERLYEDKRIPQVVLIEKDHSWGWGRTPIPLTYGLEDPYVRFVNCAKGKALYSSSEFAAYSVEPERAKLCVHSILRSKPYVPLTQILREGHAKGKKGIKKSVGDIF